MPITTVNVEVFTDHAPPDVSEWLFNRGWGVDHGSNQWHYDDGDVGGVEFSWPEALAYEMFRLFIKLK